jgi:hypothetical protein
MLKPEDVAQKVYEMATNEKERRDGQCVDFCDGVARVQ